MLSDLIVTVIGPGVMGEAITHCLFQEDAGIPRKVALSGPHDAQLKKISTKYPVTTYTENGQAASDADVIVLAIKPQRFTQVANSIKGKIKPDALVISIAAGIRLSRLVTDLDHDLVVRAMPNTPSRIGQGMTVWAITSKVSQAQISIARELFSRLGDEVLVEDESYLDMATALSGTGPAYVFLFMEAMIDAGVHMGLPRRIAEQLVVKTLQGSVEFYKENNQHPAKLRNEVTSPGGTSAEALYYLEKAGFRTAISRAIWAAFERSKELGDNIERSHEDKG